MTDFNTLIVAGIACFSGASLLMPIIRMLLIRHQVMDVPNRRSSHTAPVPRGGGIACVIGASIGAAFAFANSLPIPAGALAACLALALTGFLDDLLGLPATVRLGAQVLAGALFGAATGGASLALVGACVLPLLVNAVNFMDGINGITALTVAAWGTVIILGDNAPLPILLIATLALSSALAFLPWNAPHAKLFLGDSGSYFFGALIGTSIILSFDSEPADAHIVFAPLAFYIFDVAFTLGRRALRKEALMEAHREHLYQLLQRGYGLSHGSVSLALGLGALLIGLAWSKVPLTIAAPLTGAALFLYTVIALRARDAPEHAPLRK